jgi:hypothetical protein
MCGRLEQLCPSIRLIQIETQCEFLLDQFSKFIQSRVSIGVSVDRTARTDELLLILHLLDIAFQALNFLMQGADLLPRRPQLVTLLDLLQLLRGLA